MSAVQVVRACEGVSHPLAFSQFDGSHCVEGTTIYKRGHMGLIWSGGPDENMSITTAGVPNAFCRGDKVLVSGFVNGQNNGLFTVRRARGTTYLVQPANWWDHVTHYASKFSNWVQWGYWGAVNALEDTWNRLRKK